MVHLAQRLTAVLPATLAALQEGQLDLIRARALAEATDGLTDADAVHVARGGVPTGLVSIPIRYLHSPCELASLADIEAVIRLIVAFTRRLQPEASFLR